MAELYYGQKTFNQIVSHLDETNNAIRAKADEVGGVAKGRLAAHRDTGDASVSITHGDVDSFVNLDDSAALSIEFGHWVKGKYEDPEHPKFVPGLFIITAAAGLDSTQKSGPRRSRK
jgi:hypothetical protein